MKLKYILIIILILFLYFFINNNLSPKVALSLDSLKIEFPEDLQDVKGIIKVYGKNNLDDVVYYRINLDEWKTANGIEKWSFNLDTDRLEKGENIIYVKSKDKIKAVRINVL